MINNEEEEGKERKVPMREIKISKCPMVVALLSLEQWCNAHGANQPDITIARPSQQFLQWTQEASHCF